MTTITTVEELDALPVGSIVRTDGEQVWQRTPGGWDCLSEDGTGGVYGHETVLYAHLPPAVTVLFRPDQPVRSEATVKAEALREAADEVYGDDRAKNSVHSHPLSTASWLRERADRIEAL